MITISPHLRLLHLLSSTLLLITSLGIFQLATAQQVQLEQEVFEIARVLRCPTCVSETVADSSAAVSIEMRDIIREQLEQGRSRDEILAFFQERYGDWILLEPPRRGLHLVVWIAPVLASILAFGSLVFFFRRWTQNAQTPIEVDAEALERVRRELGREERS
jgi:cytochrome c-type biogenesis protein CcmH